MTSEIYWDPERFGDGSLTFHKGPLCVGAWMVWFLQRPFPTLLRHGLGSQGASQEYLLENRSHSVNSAQHLVD